MRVDEADVGGERAGVLLADMRHLLQRFAQLALRRKISGPGKELKWSIPRHTVKTWTRGHGHLR